MTLDIILGTIAIIFIIEGILIAIYPKKTKKLLSILGKSKKIRTYGVIEIIAGIILLLAAAWLRSY